MSYTPLTEKDRYVIRHLKLVKFCLREIAVALAVTTQAFHVNPRI